MMSNDLIGVGGSMVTSESLQAGLARQAQARADEARDAWIGSESELAAFDADAVQELGRHIT